MSAASALASLRDTGLATVGALTPREISRVNDYLHDRPVYADAHVQHTAIDRGEGSTARALAPRSERICVAHRDALLMPYLLERALALTDLVAEYLAPYEPVAYSANAFWTRPGPTPPFWDIQDFHRDADDERFLVLFLLLTDLVHPDDGPHELIGPDGETRSIYGPAGTLFLADTSYEHRGIKPKTRERGMAWFRWGISERPPAYVWDGIVPCSPSDLGERYPESPSSRRLLRLLVTPPSPG